MKEVAKTYLQELKNEMSALFKNRYQNKGVDFEKITDEIDKHGYTIIENYFTTEACKELIAAIENNIGSVNWADNDLSDMRIYFANELIEQLAIFYNDPYITEAVMSYEHTTNYDGFTLANRLEFKPGNLGSGGGWHRDLVKKKQTKAIMFLSDVGLENGPFQYIEGTHKLQSIVSLQKKCGFQFNQNRFTEEEIEKVLAFTPDSLKTITGSPGTLILVDTRGIHRGMPIKNGFRYALTNYYWFNSSIPKHIKSLKYKNINAE